MGVVDFLTALQDDPLDPDLCRQFGAEVVRAKPRWPISSPAQLPPVRACRSCGHRTYDHYSACPECGGGMEREG